MFGRVAPRIALVLVLIVSPARAHSLAGRTLADVLTILQDRGLNIIYGSALIRPDMRVQREPRATTARGIAEEILERHGLQLRDGSGGQLLIVPADRNRRSCPPSFMKSSSH